MPGVYPRGREGTEEGRGGAAPSALSGLASRRGARACAQLEGAHTQLLEGLTTGNLYAEQQRWFALT